MIWPGNGPPNITPAIQVPMNGMLSTTPSTMRRPVPDSMSSGRAYPLQPAASTSTNAATSSTQLSCRGRRNPPLKNVISSCMMIEAGITSAAQ